jgi:hypothetical protein
MRSRWPAVVATGMALLMPFAFSGCVSKKKYRLAKPDTAPAQSLQWRAAGPVDVTLTTVIVFKGPGSWKREARWDEYVVQLSNPGAQDLTVESVELIDILSQPQRPGTDPWKLEKLSYTNWEKYGKTGLKVVAGAGAVALYGAAVVSSAVGGLLGGSGAAAGGAVALNVIPAVAIVNIVVVAVINHDNKKKVQAEFDRRRLGLPLALAAGESRAGSYFFPMTPGPQRLVIRGQTEGRPWETSVDLSPLAGLHLKPAEKN